MQTVKFVTTDKEKVYVWCTTNTLTGFRNFLQYILDSSNTLEEFYMIDIEKDLVYSAYRIATEMYHMRKELLKNAWKIFKLENGLVLI